MKRGLSIAVALIAGLALAGWLGVRLWRGPDPETILARIEIPPAPVLDADQELATFRTAPGFRVEQVAAEPLVVDPVAMDWDDAGRLYVVEMRGFMGNVEGAGEDEPVGRVVVLEDTDADGRMDQSHTFLDGLVMPRAVAVLPEGVLIGVPPDLLLCRDENDDLRCEQDEQTRLAGYADEPGNVEHLENGLLPGLDGWIYNAKSTRRLRLRQDETGAGVEAEVEPTIFRGQWGIAQDDEGRLYYNHNSGFLYTDLFPAEYTLRQPGTASRIGKPGLNVDLAAGESVFGIRVAPGLNRAYQPGTLRRDGRQNGPTAVSGLVIQRGDQFGDEYEGDAFVPEAGGSAVAHFRIEHEGVGARATHLLYDDDEFDQREFLASTDERFRPVDAKVGPDGAIWVIDMYRGVIQHAHYVSEYLREYVLEQGLEPPGATGRIWRIVREDAPIEYQPPPLDRVADQLRGLDHANGWVRDRAQRALIASGAAGVETLASLRDLARFSDAGRLHALWTLTALSALDRESWHAAIAHPDPATRRLALRLAETLLPAIAPELSGVALAKLDDPDAGVRLQAAHTLGALPLEHRPIEALLGFARGAGALERQAVVSALAGAEAGALDIELDRSGELDREWLRALAIARFLAAQQADESALAVAAFLDTIAARAGDDKARALLEGALEAQRRPGSRRVVLDRLHPIFETPSDSDFGDVVLRVRRGITWPGDDRPGTARPLTPDERAQRERGAALFAQTCATCHGTHGRGNAGLAPSLVGSSWVRDADEWLVRIALQGVGGPIEVNGEAWNLVMPGHGHDPRFDDETLAGLLTHLRRSWGHADRPVSPASVARIREETAAHPGAWTAAELLALPVAHRLDRYTGLYRVPIVGVALQITRHGAKLAIGSPGTGRTALVEVSEGAFISPDVQLRFDPAVEGQASEVELTFGEARVSANRVED